MYITHDLGNAVMSNRGALNFRLLCMNLLTSMAFVFCSFCMQIRFRNETLKTEVCKKSLNPQWNSEWFKFEVSSVGDEGGEGLKKPFIYPPKKIFQIGI